MNLKGTGTSIFLIFLFFTLSLSAHGQSIRNESWVSMGNAGHKIQGQGLVIQQSIGQSSVTGVFITSSAHISQGFLRGIRALSTEIKPPFEAIAFPNSFSDRITFRFTSEHQEVTEVLIYDAQGKRIYDTIHLPKNKEIQLNLPHLATGIYVVNLRSGKKSVQIRIIKKP
jgi:hypothetical protein